MTTVVTGASGTVGRSLVAQLAPTGEPVRAMTRNPALARFPAGVEVRLEEVGPDEALRQLQEQDGWVAVNGPFILGYEGFSLGTEYPEIAGEELEPLPTVERVTGRPARSLAEWARDHAKDFR